MRIGKHNFTKIAALQVCAACVLVVLGILLGLWAWSDYSLYSNFRTGLRSQASGRVENALKPLEAVAQARADYPYPAELDAKLKVDAGTPTTLEAAIRLYQWLEANGHGDRPTVKLGLAAACMRMADLKPEAEKEKWNAQATKALSAVSWPEARILRAHMALRKGAFGAAKKDLESAYNDARQGKALVGLDSLTDLYVGLGICAAQDKHYLEASRMFRRANHLMPGARNPLLNSIYLLARGYAETPPPRDEMVTSYDGLIRRARNEWKREFDRDPQTYRGMDRAILTFVLSVAWGLVKQKEAEPHAFTALSLASGISDTPFDRGRLELTVAAACLSQLSRPGMNPGQRNEYRHRAVRALETAARHFGDQPKLLARIGYVRAMLAALEAGDNAFRDAGQVRSALQAFERAAAQLPDDARVHRDLGAVYLRAGQTEKALAAFEKSLQLDAQSPGQEKVRETVAKLKAGGSGENKP